jgi:hypothetical protein
MCTKKNLFKQSIVVGGRSFALLTDDISQLKEQERSLQEAYLDIIKSYHLHYPTREIDRESVLLLLLLQSPTIIEHSQGERGEVFLISQSIERIIITIDSALNI